MNKREIKVYRGSTKDYEPEPKSRYRENGLMSWDLVSAIS